MKLHFVFQILEAMEYFPLVRRDQWYARRPKEMPHNSTPFPYVVIHHSYIPDACNSSAECIGAMKEIQDFHMDYKGWADIGYNFVIGGDGLVYEGRGWGFQGMHAMNFNTISLGICLIGDFRTQAPPPKQLNMTQKLIEVGVQMGFISPKYKLVGHKQLGPTKCPGVLSKLIKSWDHYSNFPSSQKDLMHVTELSESVKETIANASAAYKFYFEDVFAYI